MSKANQGEKTEAVGISVQPIGVVESTLSTVKDPPPQRKHRNQKATLRIFPNYCLALAGVDELQKLMVLYWLHKGDREVLQRSILVATAVRR